MRTVLTSIAVALVALLSVAVVAPIFVDWSAHRDEIAVRLGAIAGGRVTLTGPLKMRLLPSPYIEVGPGSAVGDGPDAPQLSFSGARLELAIVKLASGAIRFTEIQLQNPVLTLMRAADGSVRLPSGPPGKADAIGFDRLAVRDGKVRLVDAHGAAHEFDNLRLDADAASLVGPFHVSGEVAGPGGTPLSFRIASEKASPAGLPFRASVDAGPTWPGVEVDGTMTVAGSDGRAPSLSGSATLTGDAGGPDASMHWKASGPIAADLDRATIDPAQFSFGSDERALRAGGSVAWTFGSPSALRIAIVAKQANVDGLLRGKDEDRVAPAKALSLLSDALTRGLGRAGPVAVEASIAAGTVILGADTLSDVSTNLRAAAGAPLHARFDVSLPGRSRLRGDGDLETGAAEKFQGAIDFASADIALLRDWATQGLPEAAAKAAALHAAMPYRSASLSGETEISGIGFTGRNLKLGLDGSALAGALAYTNPVSSDPARLFMDLTADSLDITALPSAQTSARLFGDVDLSIGLDAKALHIAQVGNTEINSGSLALKLSKSGSDIKLERLAIADLGGAFVNAEGSVSNGEGRVSGKLHADDLHDFAALVARLAPSDWSRALADRAHALSPASFAFEAHGRAAPANGSALNSFRATGSIGPTQLTISIDPGPKNEGQLLNLSTDSADAGALLRQLGLAGAAPGGGRARGGIRAGGRWSAGYEVDGSASIVGSELGFHGRVLPDAPGDDAWLSGALKAKAANATPLLSALGLARPVVAIGPVDLGADIAWRGDRWTASRLAATIAGVKATGGLNYQPVAKSDALTAPDLLLAEDLANGPAATTSKAPPEITGDLALDRLPLSALLSLSLGPPQPAKAGARWGDAKFAPAPLILPSAAVRVAIGALEAQDGLTAQNFAASVSLEKGRLELDDMTMKVAGGAVAGHAALRRSGELATLAGSLTGDQIVVNRPGFAGRIGGTLEFASTGKNPLALIEGLAGSGSTQLSHASFVRSDPLALDRVVAKAQASDSPLDETNVAYLLDNELNKAPLAIPNVSTPAALSAGVIKVGPIAIPRQKGQAELDVKLDLRNPALETRLAVTSSPAGLKYWSGPPPSAAIVVQDALDAPKRRLDVSSLSAGLATQAIARETDRIANLEADMRERAYFNRRLKAERYMEQRNREIEEWRAEQERIKGLSEKLAADRAAAAEKAATEKASAEKAAVDKAAAEKAVEEPELPPELPPTEHPLPPPQSGSLNPARGDELGANTAPSARPLSPARPRSRTTPERTQDPTASGLY